MNIADLPAVNACLNGLSAVLLTCGFWAIRRKREELHRRFMVGALCSSSLFLAGYLTYHFSVAAVTLPPAGAFFRGTAVFLATVFFAVVGAGAFLATFFFTTLPTVLVAAVVLLAVVLLAVVLPAVVLPAVALVLAAVPFLSSVLELDTLFTLLSA